MEHTDVLERCESQDEITIHNVTAAYLRKISERHQDIYWVPNVDEWGGEQWLVTAKAAACMGGTNMQIRVPVEYTGDANCVRSWIAEFVSGRGFGIAYHGVRFTKEGDPSSAYYAYTLSW